MNAIAPAPARLYDPGARRVMPAMTATTARLVIAVTSYRTDRPIVGQQRTTS